MSQIEFQIVSPIDEDQILLIANWYHEEWKIPLDKCLLKVKSVVNDESQIQVLMKVDSIPVATGGIYTHVGLLDVVPRFKEFKHWLGLVYTIPAERQRGYGGLLCQHLESMAKERMMAELYLFSDTAVSLYKRLGWKDLEIVPYGTRTVTVMRLGLLG
ncbi:N-acetyltransferase [Leptospira selangorensis]|uniref:N-acetyltransferase n=1 Tax=Leptospira selangorensis TaxID=2484982 RepID=A0ABY2NG95_9LEPT|nr:GNAT family N-acetyltransferase [Leptospira selangorensis]TGM25890.1 N-acetyltransferase [Leptospira selangorensis]